MKYLGILAAGLVLTGCNFTEKVFYQDSGLAMGELTVSLGIYVPQNQGPEIFKKYLNRMQDLGERMTIWSNPSGRSEILKLNQVAGSQPVELAPDTLEVVKIALDYARRSQGALNIALGPLTKAWGVAGGKPTLPSDQTIRDLLPLTHWEDVKLQGNQVFLPRPGMILDLGAVAKGYGADEAVRILREAGVRDGLVDVGGNLYALGSKILADGTQVPWTIGIQDPDKPHGGYLGTVKVRDVSLVTSGDYERVFTGPDGRRYHHILDSKTGYPAVTDIRGVTIFSQSSIQADCLSTATFVMGLEKAKILLASLPGVHALFITKDKKIHRTPGFPWEFKLTNGEYALAP